MTESTASVPLWVQMILLPAGGLANGLLLYYGYPTNKSGLEDPMIAAVHRQLGRVPFSTLAIKPIAALITLACGGSAGKEGPCSHIGGTLASGFGRMLRLNGELQKRIVACGVSAGFASVFDTPIARAICWRRAFSTPSSQSHPDRLLFRDIPLHVGSFPAGAIRRRF